MYVMCTYVVLYGLRKLLTVLFGGHSGALDATVILSDLYNGLIIVSHPTFFVLAWNTWCRFSRI